MDVKRAQFVNLNFRFWKTFTQKVYISKKTYTIRVLRDTFTTSTGVNMITMTPKMVIYPKSLFTSVEEFFKEFWNILNSERDGEFMMEHDVSTPFQTMLEGYRFAENTSNNIRVAYNSDFDFMNYYKFVVMAGERDKMVSRFFPVKEEFDVYKKAISSKFTKEIRFPNFKWKEENSSNDESDEMKSLMLKVQKADKSVNDFYEEVYCRSQKRDDEIVARTVNDLTINLEITEGKIELTHKKMKFWNKSRHDMFGNEFCKISGLESETTKFDQSPFERFNYTGKDSNKTPDYFLELGNRVFIIDFAVTTSNCGNAADNKRKKYYDLAIGLSDKLGKDVEVWPIVWKINSDFEMQIPDYFEEHRESLMDSPILNSLKDVYSTISSADNYEMFRTLTDNEDDKSENYEIDLGLYDDYISNLVSMTNIDNIKTDDVEASRTNKDIKLTKKEYRKMKISEKTIDSMNLDNEMYYENLVMILKDMIVKEEIPDYLKKIVNFNKEEVFEEIKSQRDKMSDRALKSKQCGFKAPKTFKMPMMSFSSRDKLKNGKTDLPAVFAEGAVEELEDGTALLKKNFLGEMDESKFEKMDEYNELGIGLDKKMYREMDSLVEFLMQQSEEMYDEDLDKEDPHHKAFNDKEWFKQIKSTNMYRIIDFWSDLAVNIAYLNGRRHIIDSSTGHTVIKDFGRYMLAVKSGSKLTSQKQIRFKIIIDDDDEIEFANEHFHSFKSSASFFGKKETKWLTMSITDINHYVKCKEVVIALASDYADKKMEKERNETIKYRVMDKTFTTLCLILMENKRGTSTTNQLNRYLVHSALGYITNRKGFVKMIGADPIRSKVEAYMKHLQLEWYEKMMHRTTEHWASRIINMASTKTDYDRVPLPSIFDLNNEIEFSMMMNEMYASNLFDKESGFYSHRIKMIVNKMSEAEKHFMNVREMEWSYGLVSDIKAFLMNNDEHHMFDKNFVVSATKFFFKSKVNKIKMKEVVLKALNATIDGAMIMSASMVSGPYMSEVMQFSETVQKSKSFLTIYDEIDKLSTNCLFNMVSQEEFVDAIFTIFPKSQIGGPREILIQAVKLRIMVKTLETVSREMCHTHEKEMLTKDKRKAELQSEKMEEYKRNLTYLRKINKPNLYCSFNSDASRWSPAYVMENFLYFVENWDIIEEIKIFCLTVVASFSNKKIMIPNELKQKWAEKPRDEPELENVEFFRQKYYESGDAITFYSGFGQGMFHFLSSFYHCVMDDFVDKIVHRILSDLYGTTLRMTTLISSDDKTKMMLFVFKSTEKATASLKAFMILMDLCYRLANIHTNWKKSALQLTITEFNSLFSIGKRMCWATIKDLYTANSIPDLTAPEEAVTFMLSNIRRCLEHGTYLTTIDTLLKLSHLQLKRFYRYDKEFCKSLMTKLECNYEDLPYQLGFMPTDMPIETLVYGLEIHMFKKSNSRTLNKFYEKIYSASSALERKVSKKVIPFSEASAGKFWFELPTHLDKKLEDIKREFMEDGIKMIPEDVLALMNQQALNVNRAQTDMSNYAQFTREFFVGMKRKYEFQETMVVHSLIRALQITRKKGEIYPRSKDSWENKEMIRELKMELYGSSESDREDLQERIKKLEDEEEKRMIDVMGFVDFILARGNTLKSSLAMYNGLSKVVDSFEENSRKISTMSRSNKFSHPVMRDMRFYMSDVGASADHKEILNYLFNEGAKPKNSITTTFNHLMNQSGVDNDRAVFNNPFLFVELLCSTSDYPFKTFVDFMKFNYKQMKFVKISMMADTSCTGNMKSNILNLYRTKSSPNYIFEDRSRYKPSSDELQFLTQVSLDSNIVFKPKAGINHINGTALERLVQLKDFCLYDEADSRMCTYDRLEYSTWKSKNSGNHVHVWTNMEMYIQITESTDKAYVAIFSNDIFERLNNSSIILTRYNRFITDLINKKKEIVYLTKDRYYEKSDLMYTVSRLMMKLKVDYHTTKWIAILEVKVYAMEKDVKSKSSDYSSRFKIYTDEYTIDKNSMGNQVLKFDGDKISLNEMREENFPIEWIDKIFVDNGWFKNDVFLGNDTNADIDEKVAEYERVFGGSGLGELFQNIGLTRGSALTTAFGNIGDRAYNLENDEERTEYEDAMLKLAKGPMDRNMMLDLRAFLEMKEEKEEISIDKYERVSVVRAIDEIVSTAILSEINVQSEQVKAASTSVIMSDERHERKITFSNVLIKNIKQLFKDISDSMVMCIYNNLMTSSPDFMAVGRTNKLKILPADIPDNHMFIKKKKDEVQAAGDFLGSL